VTPISVRRILLALPLPVTAIIVCLVTAPVAAARDPECDIILPAAGRLEQAFDLVSPSTTMQSGAGVQINNAESPLFGLTTPAAIDLRIWSSTLASHINRASAYDAATPDQVAHDLQRARQQLVAAREYCTP
jgi:hypothetical protein